MTAATAKTETRTSTVDYAAVRGRRRVTITGVPVSDGAVRLAELSRLTMLANSLLKGAGSWTARTVSFAAATDPALLRCHRVPLSGRELVKWAKSHSAEEQVPLRMVPPARRRVQKRA